MDELRTRAQVLLDHPPVDPRSMDQLRARAGQVRCRRVRRQRLAATVVVLAVAVGLYATFGPGSGSEPTVHVVVPPITTPFTVSPTTTVPAPPPNGAAAGYQPPLVAFADASNGWLAAGGGCSNGRCADPILRHSTDGGRTWPLWTSVPAVHQVTLDASSQHDLSGLVILRFADARDGWYSQGGRLWSTHDGGVTWRLLPLGPVLALDTTRSGAWALVANNCAGPDSTSTSAVSVGLVPPCPLALWIGDLSADTWRLAPGSGALGVAAGGDLLAQGNTMWLLDADHLYRSGTGGAIAEVANPCADQAGLSPIRLLDLGGGRIGALCTAAFVNGNTNTMTKVVVQSRDGGAHWSQFAVAPSTGWAGWAVGNGAGTALVVTDGQTLWRSTGGTWSRVFTPASATGEIDQLAMVSASDGFLTADDGTLWGSHDAGRTWTSVALH